MRRCRHDGCRSRSPRPVPRLAFPAGRHPVRRSGNAKGSLQTVHGRQGNPGLQGVLDDCGVAPASSALRRGGGRRIEGDLARARQNAEAGAAADAGIVRIAGDGVNSDASRSILPVRRGREPDTLRSNPPEGGQAPPWLPLQRFGAEPQIPCRAPERGARACRSVPPSRLRRAGLPASADRMRSGCAGAPRISLKPKWQDGWIGRGKQRVLARACGRPGGQLGGCAEKRRPSAPRLCQPHETSRGG